MISKTLTLILILLSTAVNAQTYAIRADRLIDGKSDKVLMYPTIVISNGRIIDVNFNHVFPDSAEPIDLSGFTLLPGLIDVHTHLLLSLESVASYDIDIYRNSSTYRAIRAVTHLRTSLMNGFTTIRDVCTEGAGYADVDLSRAVDQGFIEGPRIVPSGKGIAATGRYFPPLHRQNWELNLPSGTHYVSGADECRRAVRDQVSRGVKNIKVFADWNVVSFTKEELCAIVDEARKLKVPVAAHATSKEGIELAIACGVNSIEHGDAFDDELIQKAIERNVSWCPTVSVEEYYQSSTINARYESLNKAVKKGLRVVLGTDVGAFPWHLNQVQELIYYVENAKISPLQAIKAGTSNAADLIGRSTDLGQIREKYIADIIAVRGDPTHNIALLKRVEFVMKEGRVYKKP